MAVDFRQYKIGEYIYLRNFCSGTKYFGKIIEIGNRYGGSSVVLSPCIILAGSSISEKTAKQFICYDINEVFPISPAVYTNLSYLFRQNQMILKNFKQIVNKLT